MIRYINIADAKARNAEVLFSGRTAKEGVKTVTADGGVTKTLRVIKGTAATSYDGMLARYGSPEAVAEKLMKEDPETDLLFTGRFVTGTTRVYVNSSFKPVFRIIRTEIVRAPDGSVKEERVPKELPANVLAEFPVRGGKLFPRKEIYNRFVFARKYRIGHVNGLTFDFLYETAKELSDKDSLLMLGAGPKGNEPLVFQDGGKTYRAFLEGRVKEGKYLLLMHLSNLELKPV